MRTLLAAFIGLALVPVALHAGGGPAPQRVELYPPGQHRNPITLGFTGEVYPPEASWLGDLEQQGAELTADESFLAHAIEVNRTGSPDEVLALWNPAERAELKPLITEGELFRKNQAFYRRITATALLAKVLYGSYVIFFVQHEGAGLDGLVKVYPLAAEDGHYYLTNRLQADPVFQYLSTAYRKEIPRRKPPSSAGAGDAPSGGDR